MPSEELLEFIESMKPGGVSSDSFTLSRVFVIEGSLDRDALEHSLRLLIDRHPALDTGILVENGHLTRSLGSRLPVSVDFWKPGSYDDILRLVRTNQEITRVPADKPPLLRLDVWPADGELFVVSLSVHHGAADEWSVDVIVEDLIDFYDQCAADPNLPPPTSRDSGSEERGYQPEGDVRVSDPRSSMSLEYWRKQLKDIPITKFPVDEALDIEASTAAGSYKFRIDRADVEILRESSRKQSATVFVSLLALFKVCLASYSGQNDIFMPVVFNGRDRTEVEREVGFFLELLILRTILRPGMTFGELQESIRDSLYRSYDYRHVSFGDLLAGVADLQRLLENGQLWTLFQLIESSDKLSEPQASGNTVWRALGAGEDSGENPLSWPVEFDLTFSLRGLNLAGCVKYDKRKFRESTIAEMMDRFKTLIHVVPEKPETVVLPLNIEL